MYLTLSVPSLPYAQSISRELWLLVRPLSVAQGEVSQFYTSCLEHPDGSAVAILIPDQSMPIHAEADEIPLAHLIGAAVTADEEAFIENTISDAKGGTINVLSMIQDIDSLAPNLKTREQLEADGWFTTEEI
jgi:hypothetical protein